MRKGWINRVAILGVIFLTIIGALWLWDAKNYPILGFKPSIAQLYAFDDRWDNKHLLSKNNLYFIQHKLRERKKHKLRAQKIRRQEKEMIRSLKFEGTFWTVENSYMLKKPAAIHFRNNGTFELRIPPHETVFFAGYSTYERRDKTTLLLENKNSGRTETFTISAKIWRGYPFVLTNRDGTFQIRLNPSSNSEYFDSLTKPEK